MKKDLFLYTPQRRDVGFPELVSVVEGAQPEASLVA
jgi:hypothetical protein